MWIQLQPDLCCQLLYKFENVMFSLKYFKLYSCHCGLCSSAKQNIRYILLGTTPIHRRTGETSPLRIRIPISSECNWFGLQQNKQGPAPKTASQNKELHDSPVLLTGFTTCRPRHHDWLYRPVTNISGKPTMYNTVISEQRQCGAEPCRDRIRWCLLFEYILNLLDTWTVRGICCSITQGRMWKGKQDKSRPLLCQI